MKNSILIFFIFLVLKISFPPQVFSEEGKTATLKDYWEQKARWKLIQKLTLANTNWSYGYGAGAHIKIINGVWYLFSRKYNWGNKPSYCFINETMGIEVRKSLDEGKTWSEPTNIIIPQEGNPWECAATDGDAYYNASENKWHYLFQCMGRNGIGNGCHLEKSGLDPMGPFIETHANPVIIGKSLWQKICNETSDDCVRISGGLNKVYDEGIFNIFYYDGTYYFVSFHGYDGEKSYRGIAKTKDFINWIAGDESQGVPKDTVLDLNDAAGWRETWNNQKPVGFGAGSIFFEDGYYYQISEAMDFNLLCTDGQSWDWGIFRSNSLKSTSWEQFPAGNPIIYSSKYPERNNKPIGCNVGYARLFENPNNHTIYLHFTRESDDRNHSGIYIFQLAPSNNLLQNGNLWKCNAENWQKFPLGPTNLVVYRYPNFSSDSGCYLAINCGASSCQPGQSVYQDVNVDNISSKNISYGGKFATDEGIGIINLVIHELDGNYRIVNSHQTTLNLNSNYQSVKKNLILKPETKIARFQIYLDSSQTFRADEMFFEISDQVTPINLLLKFGSADIQADLNSDGKVNGFDFGKLIIDF